MKNYTSEAAIERIKGIIKLAEQWAGDQEIPEGQICMSALKDIRRIVNQVESRKST